jgi:hypothetical protein
LDTTLVEAKAITRRSLPRILLHFEGLAVLVSSIALYFHEGWGWVTLVVLLLAPDLAALGYLVNNRVGAITYDLIHTYALPLALLVFGVLAETPTAMQIAAIWFAHIGMDRMIGYGLKYPSGFKDTHLQRV